MQTNKTDLIDLQAAQISILQFEIQKLSWQPISNLPPDKSVVDVWSDGERITLLMYEDGKFMAHEHTSYEWPYPITHWKFVDHPPATPKGE